MNTPNERTQLPTAPDLATLMNRFLAARQDGMLIAEPDHTEVEPHDAATGFRAAIQTTWAETTAVFRLLGVTADRVAAPPDWAAFIATDEMACPPFAAGFVPQRLREHTELAGLAERLSTRSSRLPGFTGLRKWIEQALLSDSPTKLLLAVGLATALGDWDEAETGLTAAEPLCTGDWNLAWQNQKAALLWRKGEHAEAQALWTALSHNGLSQFNLGLASWQLGNTSEAVDRLDQAAELLPEHSGWSHLARLYSTLAS